MPLYRFKHTYQLIIFLYLISPIPSPSKLLAQHSDSTFSTYWNTEHSSSLLNDDKSDYQLQVASRFYGGLKSQLPYWLHANRLGMVNSYEQNWVTSLSGRADYPITSWGTFYAGGLAAIQIADDGEFILPVGYAGLSLGDIHIRAGRYIDPIGLNDHKLTLGSLMMSTNALPVPKIAIYTPDFMHVPWMEEYAEVKGLFSHGWFEQSRFVPSPYLHQKYFYLKIKIIPNVDLIAGIVHQAQWGGTHPTFGNLPDGLRDYLDIVLAQGSSNENALPGERSNVAGNSIAAYDFAIDIHLDNSELRLNRLMYLEDGVSRRGRSPLDGMWSLSWQLDEQIGFIKKLSYEHVNTIKQDAVVDYHPPGRAKYWDHGIYRDGWTYDNKIMSLPLVIVNKETIDMENNMIIAHYLGVYGTFSKELSYIAQFAYSRNYGYYYDISGGYYTAEDKDIRPSFIPLSQLEQEQYSGYIDVKYRDTQTSVGSSLDLTYHIGLTFDASELNPSQLGIMMGVSATILSQ